MARGEEFYIQLGELCRRFQEGNPSVQMALFDQLWDYFMGSLKSSHGRLRQEDREDVCADAMSRFVGWMEQLQDPVLAAAAASTILQRCVYQHLNRLQRQDQSQQAAWEQQYEAPLTFGQTSTADSVDKLLDAVAVRKHLNQVLKGQQRDIYQLFEQGNKSHQIAERLKIPPGQVRSQLSRIRKRANEFVEPPQN